MLLMLPMAFGGRLSMRFNAPTLMALLALLFAPFAVSLLSTTPAQAQNRGEEFDIAACQSQANSQGNWSPQEKWLWRNRICVGQTADVTDYLRENHPKIATAFTCDPTKEENWPAQAEIEPGFVRDITSQHSIARLVPARGVTLRCAVFKQPMALENLTIDKPLRLEKSRFETEINLSEMVTKGTLSFRDSAATGAMNAKAIQVGRDFLLEGYRTLGNITLRNASITGDLLVENALLGGIDANNIKIGGSVRIAGARAQSHVDFTGGSIASRLSIEYAEIGGGLIARQTQVSGDVLLQNAKNNGIDLEGAKIDGHLFIKQSELRGPLKARYLQVGGDLWIDGSTITKDTILEGGAFKGSVSTSESNFGGKFFARYATIGGYMGLRRATFGDDVNLRGIDIKGGLSTNESQFETNLTAVDTVIRSSVEMLDSQHRGPVVFNYANIQGKFSANRGIFDSFLFLANAQIEGNVDLSDSSYAKDVSVYAATIRGTLRAGAATYAGRFVAENANVSGDVMLNDAAKFEEITLGGANIGKQLSLTSATVNGSILASRAVVQGDVLLDDGGHYQDIDLSSSSIASDIRLTNSTFMGRVDLTSTTIGDELVVGLSAPESAENSETPYYTPNWGDQSAFILVNTNAAVLQDVQSSWDNLDGRLDLRGFTFQRMGGLDNVETSMALRPVPVLLDWLRKQAGSDQAFQYQPYKQLSDALLAAGQPDSAEEILFWSNEDRRTHPETPFLESMWLGVKLVIIGYGFEIWRSLFWVLALLITGAVVAYVTTRGEQERGFSGCVLYSLDTAVPVVDFDGMWTRSMNEKIKGLANVYFSFHRLAAFILFTFLGAGISGLMQ